MNKELQVASFFINPWFHILNTTGPQDLNNCALVPKLKPTAQSSTQNRSVVLREGQVLDSEGSKA
jgi:hypothetical protein